MLPRQVGRPSQTRVYFELVLISQYSTCREASEKHERNRYETLIRSGLKFVLDVGQVNAMVQELVKAPKSDVGVSEATIH